MLGVLFYKRKFKKDNLKHSFVYAMEWKMIQRTRTQYEYARYKWSGFDGKLLLQTVRPQLNRFQYYIQLLPLTFSKTMKSLWEI